MNRPLAQLRVVETGDAKGELCGRILADLGADVVKVEPPGGATSRRLPPFAPDGETSLWFACRNANKRGRVLDLEQPDGRVALHQLLEHADVWLDTAPASWLAAHELAPSDVLDRHPHLVVTSVTDFGHVGPYAEYVGTDMVGFAMGGVMSRSGLADRSPLVAPGALAYDTAGATAAFATVVACWQRLRTGSGQHLDVSVMESAASIGDWSLPNWSMLRQGFGQGRQGAGPVYPLYPCQDGWVRLIVLSPRQWRSFRAWLGEPEAVQDEVFDQMLYRMMAADILEPLILELFSGYTKVELAVEGQKRGIPITPVLTPAETLENQHLAGRGTFVEAEVLPGVKAKVASGFSWYDGEQLGFRSRAPMVGEHDEAEEAGGDEARPAIPTSSASPLMPFEGLRVVDFGIGAVGVEVGRLLADFGADVIKIETRTYPDFMRTVMGGWISPAFASSSRGKRSLALNVKTERGLELARQIVAEADVLIENNGTGVMEELGLGWEAVHELNPRVVMVSSQLMGAQGPWSDWIGYGPSTRPVGGMTHLWNYPGSDSPAESTSIHPDHFVGKLGAVAAIAGLLAREERGEGAHAELAQVETVTTLLSHLLLQERLTPGSVEPVGNDNPVAAPWGAYRCEGDDEWCVINVRGDDEWRRLCAVMGEPAWAARDDYASAKGRIAARADIDRALSAWTSSRSKRDVMELLQAEGIPCGMVLTAPEHADDPHLVARGYPLPVEQPPLGSLLFEGPAFRASSMPAPTARPAPLLGEHTRQICTTALGLSDADVDRLVAEGVLEEPTDEERGQGAQLSRAIGEQEPD